MKNAPQLAAYEIEKRTIRVNLRLAPDLAEKVDAYRGELSRRADGAKVDRTAALEALVRLGLSSASMRGEES